MALPKIWAYGHLGVPAYTFELGTAFAQSCAVFENDILDEALSALTYAAKVARRPYLTPAGPDIVELTMNNSRVVAGANVTITVTADDARTTETDAIQHVVSARYSVGTPSWITGTQLFTMNAVQPPLTSPSEQFATVLDTAEWEPGRRVLFVEAQDSLGNWGPPTATYLNIVSESASFRVSTLTPPTRVGDSQHFTHTIFVTNTGPLPDSYAAVP